MPRISVNVCAFCFMIVCLALSLSAAQLSFEHIRTCWYCSSFRSSWYGISCFDSCFSISALARLFCSLIPKRDVVEILAQAIDSDVSRSPQPHWSSFAIK